MKKISLSIALSLLTIPAVVSAAVDIDVTVNATAPAGHHFQGHNQYSSLATFNENIYVFSMDEGRRPYINKIDETDPNSIETSLIDTNQNDIYRVFDDGHHRFSIAIDEEGYIHVIGDMHHGNLGSKRDQEPPVIEGGNPLPDRFNGSIGDQMYWISDAPEDITSFTFIGADPAKAIPCTDLTYAHFELDNFGQIYLVSRQSVRIPRAHVPGTMGLSLWRYDISSESWEELGGIPADNYGFTGDVNPSIMWEPHGFNQSDPVWYQNYASSMKFDVYNRLHLLCAINADSDAVAGTHVVYAYSEDDGESFLRRDGTQITSVPIRITGPTENQGTFLMTQGDEDDFDTSYMGLFWDKDFNPAFSYRPLYATPSYYCYYDSVAQESIARTSFDISTAWLRTDHYTLNDGSMIFLGGAIMSHHQSFTDVGVKYQSATSGIPGPDWENTTYFMREVDDKLLRDRNILRGLSAKDGEAIVISVDLNPISIPGYDLWTNQWAVIVGAPDADYDGDGWNNLYEYAMNGDPTDALDHGTSPTFANGLLKHLRRNDDVNLIYSLETKTNLISGSWTNEELAPEAFDTSILQYDESRYTIPTDLPQNYLRLKVTQP